MQKILALDLGTNTGWALFQQNEVNAGYQVFSGTINLKNDRFQGGGMRFLRFRNWLDDINDSEAITSVYFEEVRRHIGTDAAHVYGGFLATLLHGVKTAIYHIKVCQCLTLNCMQPVKVMLVNKTSSRLWKP